MNNSSSTTFLTPSPLKHYLTIQEYKDFAERFLKFDDDDEKFKLNRLLCRTDLYWLLWHGCGKHHMAHQWLLDRCKEVEAKPNDCLDLWPREYYKSTIGTFGKSIQDILASHGDNPLPEWDREVSIGIFSVTRPIAKQFLREIKLTLETNETLKALFPEILYKKPDRESPKWALDINTPVLTCNGWKNHGDLQIGDKIYGSKGQLINIIGTSGTMYNSRCYRVVFDDCEIVASAEHLWPVECKDGTSSSWNDSKVKILKTTELKPKTKRMRLPATPILKVDYIPYLADNRIDPYILGLWLGDGTAGTNLISMHRDDEQECLDQFKNVGYTYYIHRRKEGDNFSMYGIRGLKEQLEEIGCLYNKYIPEEFLFASTLERLSLLQGLMDSDGTCKKKSKLKSEGMCMFSNTNANLADGAFFLATSLGMRPSRIKFMPKARGKKEIHHIYFVGIKTTPPFRSKRKLANCKDARVLKHRYIKAIEAIESVPVNCIKVDSEDHLYLASHQMVVTHNSEDEGIVVKRKNIVKEATVEAWGLVDGMPNSKHFVIRNYDDIVTDKSVTTSEMIQKTTAALGLSSNLGCEGGVARYYGTIYHALDSYSVLRKNKYITTRLYTCTEEGVWPGTPILKSYEHLAKKYAEQGAYIFGCQMLLNPVADSAQNFKFEWLRYYGGWDKKRMVGNIYILCDPANSKKKTSDYTVFMVIAAVSDGNYYLVDMVRDRFNLKERTDTLFALVNQHRPILVGYEQYGMQSDIEHIKEKMEQLNYRFPIKELGGKTAKIDRIAGLIPDFEQSRIYLPYQLKKQNYEGKMQDLIEIFVNEEYLTFPTPEHDDMLDCFSRIKDKDMNVTFPVYEDEDDDYEEEFAKRPQSVTGY